MSDKKDIKPEKEEAKLAFVTSVYPNKVKIEVEEITAFKKDVDEALGDLKIGSYLEISDDDGCKLIAIIESYQIDLKERIIKDDKGEKSKEVYNAYILEAIPLGTIISGKFTRGGDTLTIPPTEVKPASKESVKLIYENGFELEEKFLFAKLIHDDNIEVPVNGNKFFNKHFAVVGSSGSGKSHSIAKIIQKATSEKNGAYDFNNSHIVIFDIHNEYKTAFPDANFLDVNNLVLPYWLLNSEELEELFIDTEANDHNQKNVFKESVVTNKIDSLAKEEGEEEADFLIRKEKTHYDSPTVFDINKILEFAENKNTEQISTGEVYKSGAKEGQDKTKQGSLHGKLTNFVSRLENKLNDKRFEFLLGQRSKDMSFEEAIRQFTGYNKRKIKGVEVEKSNVTIIDLSGVPFEVLSITVSLISRILFDYGYYYKKYLDKGDLETPLLLIYEEAHKYVPKDDSAKYRSSRKSIERIAKEGRKYGVTLGIVSQRPSEISETIFSQCNNFIAMRLTNPTDQNYVKRLLPDSLGNLIDSLPSLQSGEGLLLGESIIMPSLVKIDKCSEDKKPSSNDVPYLNVWKEEWKDVEFKKIIDEWKN